MIITTCSIFWIPVAAAAEPARGNRPSTIVRISAVPQADSAAAATARRVAPARGTSAACSHLDLVSSGVEKLKDPLGIRAQTRAIVNGSTPARRLRNTCATPPGPPHGRRAGRVDRDPSPMRPRSPSRSTRGPAARGRHCRTAALVGGVLALSFVVPGDAVADIGKGTARDPAGDSDGGPSQDFVSATAQYDSNGSLTVSATMRGNIAMGPESLFSFGVASFAPPESCTGVTASLFGFSRSKTGTTTLEGHSGTASIAISANKITFTASGPAYANKSFSCLTASVAPKRQSH